MTSKLPLTKKSAIALAGLSVLVLIVAIILQYFRLYISEYQQFYSFIILGIFGCVLPLLAYGGTRNVLLKKSYVYLFSIVGAFWFYLYVGAYNPFVFMWVIPMFIASIYGDKFISVVTALLLPLQTTFTIYMAKDMILNDQNTNIGWAIVVLSEILALLTVAGGLIINYAYRKAVERTAKLAESQHAEELQINRLNTLLNSISDTVLTLNRYGRVTSQNSAALSFFDTNQSLVGKNIDTLMQFKDANMKPISLRKMALELHTTEIHDDISITDSNDGIMRLNVQLSPIHGKFGEDENGCVVIIRDITKQKTLEDEKDEFISVTSHELRTPIAIAEGSLSNLVFMFDKGAKPEQLVSSANTAHDQVLYLARMINDLSTLSRAERGVGDVAEEIDVNVMLQDLYLRYQTEAEAKGLKLNLDLDKLPIATTSRLYLEEIIQNFLTNAIKYTKEGSVTLSGKLKDGKIECAVSDTGIGISKSDKEKVFDKFFRSEDYRTRETSGTGLGLYVVSKLASKLDTKVDVTSRLNHGSRFSFILPLTSNKLGTGKRTSV